MESFASIIQDTKTLFKTNGFILALLFIVQFSVLIPSIHIYLKVLFGVIVILSLGIHKYSDSISRWIFAFVVIYSISIVFNGVVYSVFELLGYIFCPLSYYFIGKAIYRRKTTNSEIITFLLLLVAISCVYLYYISIIDIQKVGLINPMRMIGTDGKNTSAVATLLGVIASLGFAGFSYPIVCDKPWKSFRANLFLLLLIFSLLTVIHLINRTGIVVVAVVGILTTLYSINGRYKKIVPLLLLFVSIYLILSYTGILGNEVLDAYENRNLDEDNAYSANGRFNRWVEALTYMLEYPMGWSNQPFSLYCHNLWFDVARMGGILPFIILTILTLKVLSKTIQIISIRNNKEVGTILGFIVCTFLSASVEPIMEGASTYFCTMCLIWGLQSELLAQKSKTTRKYE